MLKKKKIVFGPSFPNLIPTKKKVKPSKFSEKEEKLREEEHWNRKKKKLFQFLAAIMFIQVTLYILRLAIILLLIIMIHL